MSVPEGKIYRRNVYDQFLRWLGAWVGTTSYVPGDVVSSGGHVYICTAATTNNVPPNASFWIQTG